MTKEGFGHNFLALEFFEIFSAVPTIFRVIFELFCYKQRQKLENFILLTIYDHLFEIYQKMSILVKKGQSGVPYLKKWA